MKAADVKQFKMSKKSGQIEQRELNRMFDGLLMYKLCFMLLVALLRAYKHCNFKHVSYTCTWPSSKLEARIGQMANKAR